MSMNACHKTTQVCLQPFVNNLSLSIRLGMVHHTPFEGSALEMKQLFPKDAQEYTISICDITGKPMQPHYLLHKWISYSQSTKRMAKAFKIPQVNDQQVVLVPLEVGKPLMKSFKYPPIP